MSALKPHSWNLEYKILNFELILQMGNRIIFVKVETSVSNLLNET